MLTAYKKLLGDAQFMCLETKRKEVCTLEQNGGWDRFII